MRKNHFNFHSNHIVIGLEYVNNPLQIDGSFDYDEDDDFMANDINSHYFERLTRDRNEEGTITKVCCNRACNLDVLIEFCPKFAIIKREILKKRSSY